MAEITYNGNTIAALASGQTATLACKDKIMASDVLITGTCSVEYNGVVIAELAAGQTATLACKDKIMATNVVVTVAESALEPLPTPSITLDGDTLSITDESGLAEEFVILVDGVETATVSAMISFAIWWESWAYQAEQGMTWREWIVSEYNTDGWYLREDESGIRYDEYNGITVDLDAEIIDGRIYFQRYTGGLN